MTLSRPKKRLARVVEGSLGSSYLFTEPFPCTLTPSRNKRTPYTGLETGLVIGDDHVAHRLRFSESMTSPSLFRQQESQDIATYQRSF
jgi:hypothetical protein